MRRQMGFTLIELLLVVVVLAIPVAVALPRCGYGMGDFPSNPPTSSSGVSKASVTVSTGADGMTMEQRNIRQRLLLDNKVGSIKHLYVLSAYSGQVLIYSTVQGKVTSSGKRLTPVSLTGSGEYGGSYVLVNIGGYMHRTAEVLQDDGTYGSSAEYIYWWDTRGIYHQHYVTGGQIVHVSDQPLAVKSIVLNMELTTTE